MLKNKTYVLKVTDSCNMNCKYCYISEDNKNKHKLMRYEVIDKFFERLKEESEGNVKLIWHGGEPLLRDLTFFEFILEEEKSLNLNFKNSIQTNGLLIDERKIEFFVKNDVGIGISFDGPKDIHDLIRPGFNDAPTYDKVCNSIEKVLDGDTKKFGLLTVITKYHIGKEKELFDDYKRLGVNNVKLNPLFISGKGAECGLEISAEDLADFLINIYNIWVSEKESDISIIPLDSLIAATIGQEPTLCIFREEDCYSNYIEINPNGDIYPCGKYAGIDSCGLGNIFENSLSSAIEKKEKMKFEYETIDFDCILGKGCLFDRYISKKSISLKLPAYLRVMKHIKEDLLHRDIL
jgi:uncharacterized protein